MYYIKKYSGWLLFLLILTTIFGVQELKQRYIVVDSFQNNSLSESIAGKLSFLSFDHTYILEENKKNRRKSYINGILQFPDVKNERVPAIILLHGSLGVSSVQSRYARELNKAGIATLIVDSFSSRGITDTVGKQSRVTFNTVIQDAYTALHLLQRHPRIEPHKIAVMGWSKGGYAAHQAGTQYFYNSLHNKSTPSFAAHIAINPWCGEHTTNFMRSSAPTLFILGDEDSWVGHEACVTYVNSLVDVGHDVMLRIYSGVDHGFDYAGAYQTYLPRGLDWSNCEYVANENGFVIAATGEVIPWTRYVDYLHKCSTKGVYLKSNVHARDKAIKEVLEFLKIHSFISAEKI